MDVDATELSPDTDFSSQFDRAIEVTLARIQGDRLAIIVQMAHASLDADALDDLQRQLEALPADSRLKTGLNLLGLPRYWAVAASQVAALDLDRLSPLRVLGVGRAVGHFLFCAKALHHQVTAASPSHEVYDKLMTLYGIPCLSRSRGNELPDDEFHVIAAGNQVHGSEQAWLNFLRPLGARLTGDGHVFLTLFKHPAPARSYVPEVALAMFERIGAQVSRDEMLVLLKKDQIERWDSAPIAAPTIAPSPTVVEAVPAVAPTDAAAVETDEAVATGEATTDAPEATVEPVVGPETDAIPMAPIESNDVADEEAEVGAEIQQEPIASAAPQRAWRRVLLGVIILAAAATIGYAIVSVWL